MTTFQIVAAAIVATLATARIIRLVIWDVLPPVAWVRAKWIEHAPGGWVELLKCGYCFGVYPAIANVAWAYFADLSDWHDPWWIVNGTLALAYLAAIVVSFDGELVED